MGNKWELSPMEVEKYRSRIVELKNNMSKLDKYLYFLLIVWVYEYLELYVVNGTNLHAGLKPVKEAFPGKEESIRKLFRIRCVIVHKAYSVSNKLISESRDIAKDINEILMQCGFKQDIL